MVETSCPPFNSSPQATWGWEGLEPYSKDSDEGLHGWKDSDSNKILGLNGKKPEMGEIVVAMDIDEASQAINVGTEDVKRGYTQWLVDVAKDEQYNLGRD